MHARAMTAVLAKHESVGRSGWKGCITSQRVLLHLKSVSLAIRYMDQGSRSKYGKELFIFCGS